MWLKFRKIYFNDLVEIFFRLPIYFRITDKVLTDIIGKSRYFRTTRRVLERHGGTVEKFIGDAVMAVFGAPVAHGDDPERAVRCALAMLDAIGELNKAHPDLELAVRIGIATGEALVAWN